MIVIFRVSLISVENVLADIADQNIQQQPEISSPKSIDPYLKILEEPGDTRFRYIDIDENQLRYVNFLGFKYINTTGAYQTIAIILKI